MGISEQAAQVRRGLHAAVDKVTAAYHSKDAEGGSNWELCHKHQFTMAGLDQTVWDVQTGDGTAYGLPPGWGNHEPQIYTASEANLGVMTDGDASNGCALYLKATHQDGGYTSARIRARPESVLGGVMPEQREGASRGVRITIRARLPPGARTGVWPAFWMLPSSKEHGGWAASGEIDIMEAKQNENLTHATLHFGDVWPRQVSTSQAVPFNGRGAYHEWAVEWRADSMRWFTDGKETFKMADLEWHTKASSKPAAPFDVPFHLILNLAAGGEFSGKPDAADFPQTVAVDWITVHRECP